jgi:ubiquinol-cytochrome c reductase cytochrome c1 subunit
MNRTLRLLRLVCVAAVAGVAGVAAAAGGAMRLDRAQQDVRDVVSLQSGARTFVNYCLNCHSASMVRYNRLRDIGLTDEQIRDNLMFSGGKVGELMSAGLSRKDGKQWFGAAPPDLSVVARSRGPDWLYTYLRTFYRDPATVTGWNNLVFDRVAMPHALWTLSGQSVLESKEFRNAHEAEQARGQSKSFAIIDEKGEGDAKRYIVKTTRVVAPGSMSAAEYDGTVRDLVNFMVWMGEPAQQSRVRLGIAVLLFLAVLLVLTWLLYKAFWKDVH